METFSYIIAVALGLSAIISPIVTTLINNYYSVKQKQIENYELAKRKALSDYIEASHIFSTNHVPENEANFYIALNKLFLFFPDLSKDDFQKLSETYSSSEEQNHFSHKLIEKLSKQINKN